MHFDTETGLAWNLVGIVLYIARVNEMFMKMIGVFNHPVTDVTGYLHIVDHRQVLHVLTQSNAAGVGKYELANFAASM